jgi:phytoene synthase
MLEIFGYTDTAVTDHAVNLGIAMQLTNILRDIKEDLKRGRIYLPQDEMERFGVSENDIFQSRVNDNFKALMKFQIDRARQYYQKAKQGIHMLADLKSRLVAQTMAEIYAGILETIEKNDYDIFTRRAGVNTLKKINTIIKIMWKGKYR